MMECQMKNNQAIILIPDGTTPEQIESSIAAYNKPLADLLIHIGLPTENILSPIEERRKVIFAIESTLEILPKNDRPNATYLSKFMIAVAVGLFDGAINFLWDETIRALRRLVIRFDLEYFLGVAQTISNKYKSLTTAESLEAISDYDLLDISRRVGLISEINFHRLAHTNYLRNHASAAHPNENAVSGIEMLGLLEICLKYAIVAVPDHSIILVKKLFDNIRRNIIPSEDFSLIGKEILKLPQERIDDFVLSLFGIYTDTRSNTQIRDNIEGLNLEIWSKISEDTKLRIGSKFGYYRKNGDVDRKDLVQKYLESVNGLIYKDEDSLSAELMEKLQNLKTVHFEWNNFYYECDHAKSLKSSLPVTGIPKAVRKLFVKVVCMCYVGNGRGFREGVDENALAYYKDFISAFTIIEIIEFIFLFRDAEFVQDFNYNKPDQRLRKLSKYFLTKTKDTHVNKILELIINFPKNRLQQLAVDLHYRESSKFIQQR